MTARAVIRLIPDGQTFPYVHWSCGFTQEARTELQVHFGSKCLEQFLHNHLLKLGSDIGFFEEIEDNRFRDAFGVS